MENLALNPIEFAVNEAKINANIAEAFIDQTLQFQIMMMMYNSAVKEIRTKFEILNDDLAMRNNRNPIEFITHRIKKPISIMEKLKRKNLEVSPESIFENLNDVAGVRVICSFIDDIYQVAEMLTRQDDIKLIEVKDYIKNPKPNGYRSYHMIVEVPVFFTDKKENMKVEIQLRTIAMDFWASLEHQLKYKKNISNEKEISKRLYDCANTITKVDLEMQNIRKQIEESSEPINNNLYSKLERLSNGLLKPNYS